MIQSQRFDKPLTTTVTRVQDMRWLRYLRLGWLFLVALFLTIFLLTLPYQFALLRDSRLFAVGYQQVLDQLGISRTFFALYFITFDVVGVGVAISLAAIVFSRSSDDWMALFISLTLVIFEVYICGYIAYTNLIQWTYVLDTIQTFLYVTAAFIFPDGRFFPAWTRRLLIPLIPIILVRGALPGAMPLMVTVSLIILCASIQVMRFRRASTLVQRQQTKWVVFGAVILAVVSVIYLSVPNLFPSLVTPLNDRASPVYSLPSLVWMMVSAGLIHFAFLLLPVLVVFSILRYRLWEVDLVINRSLVYGVVTVVLGALFILQFLVAQTILRAVLGSEQSGVAVALSAAVTTALFNPARKRVRHIIDRDLYGFRFDLDQLAAKQYPLEVKNAGLFTGQKFGNYEVLGVIGKGGMGEVYKGQGAGKTVALKILPEIFALEREFRARFQREAQMLTALDHPSIVKMFGAGESGGVHYMAMDFIDGIELSDYIRQREKLTPDEARQIVREVASALDYAHSCGLVHRDIKPSNVMLQGIAQTRGVQLNAITNPLHAVLMDFGVAKFQDAQTHLTGTNAIGTIDYMAPEQIKTAKEVDHRADIYALGVMVYEMVTGERPFKGHAGQVLFAHLYQPAPDPRSLVQDLPAPFANAILRALTKDPSDRFQSVGEFANALG
jgi:hypothetical protein